MLDKSALVLRTFRNDDDHEKVLHLANDTIRRYYPKFPMKQLFHPNFFKNYDGNGFVAEISGEIVALMVMGHVDETGTTSLAYGWREFDEGIMNALLEKCKALLRKNGGNQIAVRSFLEFGQIRNPMIVLWERIGFVPDEYMYSSMNMDLSMWNSPEHIDMLNIEPATRIESAVIHEMLVNDGEQMASQLFLHQYVNIQDADSPNRIVFILRDSESQDIAGVSYYKIIQTGEGLSAVAFGMHFKPKYGLPKSDKVRLLQATLASMKQLNLRRAVTRITLKGFDVFAAMVSEGFESITSELHSINLYASV